MRLPTDLNALIADSRSEVVYGQPFEAADGSTIITVAKVRSRGRGGDVDTRVRPLGLFVIRGGEAKWVSALDGTRLSELGTLVGLVAATISTLTAGIALVRRPPWPDLTLPGWSPAENPSLRRRR